MWGYEGSDGQWKDDRVNSYVTLLGPISYWNEVWGEVIWKYRKCCLESKMLEIKIMEVTYTDILWCVILGVNSGDGWEGKFHWEWEDLGNERRHSIGGIVSLDVRIPMNYDRGNGKETDSEQFRSLNLQGVRGNEWGAIDACSEETAGHFHGEGVAVVWKQHWGRTHVTQLSAQ